MLHGRGEQAFLTKKYEKDRRKLLRDSKYATSAELTKYEITGSQGGGMTLETTYELDQFPFPIDQTIRKRKTIDVRKLPKFGCD